MNFAEFAGKNRSGQCGQLALTSTSTLLAGTTICSCLVGIGGFLYWRRAFWICCLTSSRAASSVGACAAILGKSGTWAVQPSGDIVTQGYCRGSGVHPGNVHVDDHMLCLQNMFPLKAGGKIKADTHTNSYMLRSESTVIHPKILTRKSESVLIHAVI